MERILRIFLTTLIKKGSLNIETASGQRFTVGDDSPPIEDVKFCDRGAERDLLSQPRAGFGELFNGRADQDHPRHDL